jgi:ribose 5-phosphate isomerase A
LNPKQIAAEKAVEYVKNGMIVGLGTGSTAEFAVKKIGQLVTGGLDIIGIPTSRQTERLAKECGIKLSTLDEHGKIDVTIDGADEVDPHFNLIKGMGGALLWEKIVASNSKIEIIVVDSTKNVNVIGTKSSLPVEVVKFGWKTTSNKLKKLGCAPTIRMFGSTIYATDSGNYILDCSFKPNGIKNAKELEREINNTPGVVENGLFIDLTDIVIIGSDKGVDIKKK